MRMHFHSFPNFHLMTSLTKSRIYTELKNIIHIAIDLYFLIFTILYTTDTHTHIYHIYIYFFWFSRWEIDKHTQKIATSLLINRLSEILITTIQYLRLAFFFTSFEFSHHLKVVSFIEFQLTASILFPMMLLCILANIKQCGFTPSLDFQFYDSLFQILWHYSKGFQICLFYGYFK